ncbi:MAG: hypothetical protein LAQ69_24575 [Acidobacteriia bacterium]|nr:hypothetical protein [Terriglobia bacterium]
MVHWERLKSDKFNVCRAAVPGGWIVKCHSVLRSRSDEYHPAILGDLQGRHLETILLRIERTLDEFSKLAEMGNLVFLPDPEHQWDGTSPRIAPELRIGG